MIDQFMHKLTLAQALALCMSELPFSAEVNPASTEDILQQDHISRHEFGKLSLPARVHAILWLRGQIGEGCNWDNRRCK